MLRFRWNENADWSRPNQGTQERSGFKLCHADRRKTVIECNVMTCRQAQDWGRGEVMACRQAQDWGRVWFYGMQTGAGLRSGWGYAIQIGTRLWSGVRLYRAERHKTEVGVGLCHTQHKTTQRTDLSFRSHCDLSIERVCLGTNMADSNRCQGKSHVGENQEFSIESFSMSGVLVNWEIVCLFISVFSALLLTMFLEDSQR